MLSQFRIYADLPTIIIPNFFFVPGRFGLDVPGTNGSSVHFYGSLIAFLADTLAAHDIGGFKVGVGFALRKCRLCLATNEEIQYKVSVVLFLRVI